MCHPKHLAASGGFRLDACHECEHLSVHLGPVTVRLDPHALRNLHGLLGEALRRLDEGHDSEANTNSTALN